MADKQKIRAAGGRNGARQISAGDKSGGHLERGADLGPAPSGSPDELDARIRAVFDAHLAYICAEVGSKGEASAKRRRDNLLLRLGRSGRGYAVAILNGLGRVCSG